MPVLTYSLSLQGYHKSSNRKGPLGKKKFGIHRMYLAHTLYTWTETPIQINWFSFYFLHSLHNVTPSHPRPSKQSPRFPPRAAIIPPRPAITLILLSLDYNPQKIKKINPNLPIPQYVFRPCQERVPLHPAR